MPRRPANSRSNRSRIASSGSGNGRASCERESRYSRNASPKRARASSSVSPAVTTSGNSSKRACVQPPSTGSKTAVRLMEAAEAIRERYRASAVAHGTASAGAWARALNAGGSSAATRVYRNLDWLEKEKLVYVDRSRRIGRITLLREDGSGQPYHHPGSKVPGQSQAEGNYLQLPTAFWTERWHQRLSLPAKAVLLIALSLSDDFCLLQERAPEWYGISADSLGRGLRTLRDEGLLSTRAVRKAAPLTSQGHTIQLHYTLQHPFGPRGRARNRSLTS